MLRPSKRAVDELRQVSLEPGVAKHAEGSCLVKFGDTDIGNLYDFTYALRAHKPGDEVEVEVLRGGQTVTAKVLLTERK